MIKHKGNQEYEGLSSDTKPVASDTAVNATFAETDTGLLYRNNGTAWVEYSAAGGNPGAIETLTNKTISFDTNTFPLTPTSTYYTVYKSGSNTKCRDNVTGTIVSSSATNPEVPINFATTDLLRRSLFIAEGTYNILAGLSIPEATSEARVYLDAGAFIVVPNGFSGSAWGINKGVSLAKIQGGKYYEAGTPQSLWTCFSLNNQTTTAQGINSCQIDDCYIRYALHGIRLTSGTTSSWLNSNRFHNIFMDRCVNGVTFVDTVPKQPGNGSSLNTFWNIIVQMTASAPLSLRGFRDISGDANQFYGCAVWDTAPGGISANLTPEATNTLIVGGKMSYNISDLGIDTLVWDSAKGLKMGKSVFASNKAIMCATSQQWGTMNGLVSAGDGCLATPTVVGTPSNNADYADGLFVRYTSAGASGDNAGFRTTFPVTYRGWYPYFEATFRVNQTANSRCWVGWGDSTEPTGDDAFNAKIGVGCGFRTTDTNFMFFRNEGAGPTSYTDNFFIAKDTAIHNVKLFANDAVNSFQVVFDGISVTSTSNVPTQQQALYPMFQVEASTAAAVSIDRFGVDIKPGKNTLL